MSARLDDGLKGDCHSPSRTRLHFAFLILGLACSPCISRASEWYWINDLGGIWDQEVGGFSGWRDPGDHPGLPGLADDALLVLPYSFSFPGFTQPVVVQYRGDVDPHVYYLILESDNRLLQQETLGTEVRQLALSSFFEVVGGSGWSFRPPPSFPLPDPPGVFPVGRHIQTAGTNHVELQLMVGGVEGSEGWYELSGDGMLEVPALEVIGDSGAGHFIQAGGRHEVSRLHLGRQATGQAFYLLSGGELDAGTVVVGMRGVGKVEQSQTSVAAVGGELRLGEEAGGEGSYTLGDVAILDVGGDAYVGNSGVGHFIQTGGRHELWQLYLGREEGSVGTYELGDGELVAAGAFLGREGVASFHQTGGTFDLTSGVLSDLHIGPIWTGGGSGSYRLEGGQLRVGGATLVGGRTATVFTQTGGEHDVGLLIVSGGETSGVNSYSLEGGLLRAQEMELRQNASFYQTGGVVRVAERLALDQRSSSLTLEGGVLEVGGVLAPMARVDVRGEFEQNGELAETYVYGDFSIGLNAAAYMREGTMEVSGDLSVGETESGAHFRQSGGRTTVERLVSGGTAAMAWAICVLDEGILHIRDRLLNERESQFEQKGGRLELDTLTNRGILKLEAGEWVGREPGTLPVIENARGGRMWIMASDPREVWLTVLNAGWCELAGEIVVRGVFWNGGTLKVADRSRVGFIDMFIDGGRLEVDPATVEFQGGLTVETNGYLAGWTPQDRFVVEGDFLNHSEQASLWDTANATLVLSANGTQRVECPGEARGDTAAGWNDNFAWGRVEIREGARVEFVDGNTDNQGTAFYVGVLDIQDRSQVNASGETIQCLSGDATLFYDVTRPENGYLAGGDYAFAEGGGGLVAQVPPVRPRAELSASADGLNLSFPSQSGVEYSVEYSTDCVEFVRHGVITGTGDVVTYSTPFPSPQAGYFTVKPLLPKR